MKLLTSREAAERLNITIKVLHSLRAHGRIHYIAITDRKILYRPEDCDAWVADGAQRGTRKVPSNGIVPFSQRRDQA